MQKPSLTIIMAHLNEGSEPLETIQSILATTPRGFVEIVAVDDCSDPGMSIDLTGTDGVRVFRNSERRGLFAAKDFAVAQARTNNLMVIDAHMRFKPDNWAEKMVNSLLTEPETAFCTTCLGLGWKGGKNKGDGSRQAPDINRPNGRYHGGTIIIRGPRKNKQGATGIHWLEPKWQGRQQEGTYELPSLLGANYGITKSWWDKIGGLRGLKSWGGQEACLSLKTWLAGGKCKIMTDIEIGHIFRSSAPYGPSHVAIWHNKMRMALTILPDPHGRRIHDEIAAKQPAALAMIRKDLGDVIAERAAFMRVRKSGSLDALVEKFDLQLEW